jgi:hypothetical protein
MPYKDDALPRGLTSFWVMEVMEVNLGGIVVDLPAGVLVINNLVGWRYAAGRWRRRKKYSLHSLQGFGPSNICSVFGVRCSDDFSTVGMM